MGQQNECDEAMVSLFYSDSKFTQTTVIVDTTRLKELGPHYETGTKLRQEALHKLTTEYWWRRITNYLR